MAIRLGSPTPPDVREGAEVWCRRADGQVARMIVRGLPFSVVRVPVSLLDAYRSQGAEAPLVDWPAEDVVPGDQPPPGPVCDTAS
jgi:hypothetical protein